MRPLELAHCAPAIACGARQHDRALLEAQLKILEPLASALEEAGQVSSLVDALGWLAVAHASLDHPSEALAIWRKPYAWLRHLIHRNLSGKNGLFLSHCSKRCKVTWLKMIRYNPISRNLHAAFAELKAKQPLLPIKICQIP